jgi:serine/threonine protein kinase
LKHCRLGNLLGSGQFGTVCKGTLSTNNDEVEVAVKTLKEGSGEEDRVKFLQEVAIMGQFKHPNVVEMYGVVTQGEPVSVTYSSTSLIKLFFGS